MILKLKNMGIDISFTTVYGFKFSSDVRHKKTNKEIDYEDEKLEPYTARDKKPFTLLGPWYGTNQDVIIFGQELYNEDKNYPNVGETNINELRTDEVKQFYVDLFKDYDVPMDVEPKLIFIVYHN